MWGCTLVGGNLEGIHHIRWMCVVSLGVWGVRNVMRRSWRISIWSIMLFCAVGMSSGSWAWGGVKTPVEGECSGVVTLKTDPTWVGYGTGVVVQLHGVRYRAIVHGVAGRRLSQRLAGERVFITAICSASSGQYARVDAINHVLGRMNVSEVSEDFAEGSPVVRAANRMRRAIAHGVRGMSDDLRSLFTGLVMGDDRNQSRDMLQNFRESGLSHLCAVSGQNVAYLLAAMSPLLKRMNPLWRWCVVMFLLGWFVLLTRAEPSVLRAAFMASLVATNALLKFSLNARTVLGATVIALLIIDPMLAWSVGFALSVGATAGLAWCSAPLSKLVKGRGVLAATLSAQVGTFPVSWWVFGGVPVISLLANPLALGIAGMVMMIGLPLALIAYAFPFSASIISVVLSVPVWFVNEVAVVCALVSPRGLGNWLLWLVVLLVLLKRRQQHG